MAKTTTTTTIKFEVVSGYGMYFANVENYSTLKEAWEAYKEHKTYVMADYGIITRIEFTTTTTKKGFFKKKETTKKALDTIIKWGR